MNFSTMNNSNRIVLIKLNNITIGNDKIIKVFFSESSTDEFSLESVLFDGQAVVVAFVLRTITNLITEEFDLIHKSMFYHIFFVYFALFVFRSKTKKFRVSYVDNFSCSTRENVEKRLLRAKLKIIKFILFPHFRVIVIFRPVSF